MASAEIVDTPEEAEQQELVPLIVRRPLERFMDENGLGEGEIEAERIGEGHSNVTYEIRRGGERFVLRRPPRPPLPPSAHDVLREARLLRAIQDADVRTPTILAVCDDESVLAGVPFYLMKYEVGHVITGTVPDELDNPEERHRVCEELVDALVEMHAVDWQGAGLDGFGKPTGYLDRQLKRFGGLWEHNKTRELPLVQEVGEWLAANKPESPAATIVHGDYRLGNVMFADEPQARLNAIFDWEMATIGDPLADVGYMLMHWTQPDDALGKFNAHNVTLLPGFPTRAELTAAYEERSGRSVQALDWYVTLALWKAVVFMEGNYKRALAGSTDDPYLKSFGEGVIEIADRALTVTRDGF
jgi:aminoglycoside phosphotransferase (APT) family kinase protein